MFSRTKWILILLLTLSLGALALSEVHSAPLGNNTVLENPTACPPGGCAAGQRLTLKADFNLSVYQASASPNVQICVYTPTNWSTFLPTQDLTGGVSGAPYSFSTTYCTPPPSSSYNDAGGFTTSLPAGSFGDALSFGFRIGKSATQGGTVLVRVLEWTGPNPTDWVQTGQTFISISVIPTGTTVYVANDAGDCGSFSPCYINSGGDFAAGLGTGLKDAVDAASSGGTANILGTYLIKSNTVLLDRPLKIQGFNNSTLTSSGQICGQAMLQIGANVTLSNLNLNDGGCTVHRDLVLVESPTDVAIESNTLTGGKDAIKVLPASNGNLMVRYNQITSNAGYAIIWQNPSSTGTLTALANNLFSNQAGIQVDCGNKGLVNHNYWGQGVTTASAAANCTFTENLRLGAGGLVSPPVPGIAALQTTVTNTKTYNFNNQIAYQWTTAGSDFNLYIINHGSNSDSVPFTSGQPGNLTSCSSYWSAFLPDGTTLTAGQKLALNLKYNLNPGCITTIESATYCGQSADPGRYPLWWYNLTNGLWTTTGTPPNGQVTTCDTSNKEIQVLVDDRTNHPDSSDLINLPVVVGLQGSASSVVFSSFTAAPGNTQILVKWVTTSEIATSGYYVLRSTNLNNGYVRVRNEFVPATGSGIAGANYQFVDTGLTNGTTYYYRLEIIATDLSSRQTASISAAPAPPTATPTPTASRTPTITRTFTRTATTYRSPTSIIYPTWTRTPTRSATPTSSFRSVTPTFNYVSVTAPAVAFTLTPNRTTSSGQPTQSGGGTIPAYPGDTIAAPTQSQGGTNSGGGYPGPGGSTVPAKTTNPKISLTPSPAGTHIPGEVKPETTLNSAAIPGTDPGSSNAGGLSQVLAILALFIGFIAIGWYFLRGKINIPPINFPWSKK